MLASRKLIYRTLIFPNQAVEFMIRCLTYARKMYCEFVWAGPNELFYQRPHQQERVKWLEENVSGKSLEIGCSTGYITETLNIGVGLDLDLRRLRRGAWFRPSRKFVNSDGSKLPFADKMFDTVLVPEILEHVPFVVAQNIVSEACRVGSRVLITIPKLPKFHKNPEHLWIPTDRAMLETLLGDRNFVVKTSPDEDYYWIIVYSPVESNGEGKQIVSRDR